MVSTGLINSTWQAPQEKMLNNLPTLPSITLLIYRVLSLMSFYYEILFIPFGLLFNMFIILVFGITSLGTTKTTRIYYLAMAYGEFGTVLFKDAWYFWACLGLPYVAGGLNPIGPLNSMGGIASGSPAWMCSLQVFLWYSHEMFANYAFIVFELERVAAIFLPLHARRLFTKRRTLITMIGVGLVVAIVCAPNFVIDLQKLYGVSLLHPFGIICIFNSSVPIWGAFGVALPLLNYLVPAFVSTLLTALLSVRLLRHTRQHQSRLASQEVMRVGSSFENSGGSSGGRSTASKQLPVNITILLMALMRLTFYVPLACVRVAALFITAMGAEEDASLLLTGVSFVFYVCSAPVHLANFIVHWVRVPGFSQTIVHIGRRALIPCSR